MGNAAWLSENKRTLEAAETDLDRSVTRTLTQCLTTACNVYVSHKRDVGSNKVSLVVLK
jgi:hypothetical protein